jgi:hypothetical protein
MQHDHLPHLAQATRVIDKPALDARPVRLCL